MNTATERAEGVVQVLILLAIGGMAGAASFTHMHDWTMQHATDGTGEWFGWANAVISELTPLAAGLEARRRRRAGQPTGYPIAVLIAFAGLSLAAQFSQASPSVSGWLLAGLPAIGFLALVKLVLAGPARPGAPAVDAAELVDHPAVPEPTPAHITAPLPVHPIPRVNGTPLVGEVRR